MSNFKKLIELKDEYEKEKEVYEHKLLIISILRLLSVVVAIVFLFVAIFKFKWLFILMSLFIILFIFFVIYHKRLYKIYDNFLYRLAAIKDYEARRDERWKHFKDDGMEFYDKDNYIENDLDIFGSASLYKYINVCKTGFGKRRLAGALKDSDEDILKNQEAVEELKENPQMHLDLESSLRVYEKNNQNTKVRDLENALNLINNKVEIKPYVILCGVLILVINVTLLILTILGITHFAFNIGFVLLSFILLNRLTPIREIKENVSAINDAFIGYDTIISTYIKYDYKSSKLSQVKDDLKKISASTIKKYNILESFITSSNNILYSLIFNGCLAVDIWVMLFYNGWQNKHAKEMKDMVLSVAEVEMLLSLSVIPLSKDNVCKPVISSTFTFEELNHPLITESVSVPNDFTLDGLNIITGSNMSGKTTFMRSIGLNYILFKAGSFVCAKTFSADIYKLFTSMKVSDDVSNGISTFYGEILRIKKIIDYIPNQKKMLVLVDEIFKGTNTLDRLTGAEEVIKHLNKDFILSIITTHDFELCNILGTKNYHFQEYYEDNQIKFDYKIKTGVSKTRNAIYLLKMAGIVREE